MGFNHRVPALSTACIASAALCLAVLSGLSCEFLDITAEPDMLLVSANEIEMTVQTASIGILCENGFYEREGDKMWEISRLFLLIALGLGSLSCALAWAVTTFLPPTELNWRLLSFFASLTAVLQVPMFLIFEAEPCAAHKQNQSCSLGMGSYYVIASVIFWVAVTLATQLLDPPMWAMELSAWRVKNEESRRRRIDDDLEVGDDGFPMFVQNPEDRKRTNSGCFGGSKKIGMEVRANSTESLQDEDFEDALPPRNYRRSPSARRPRNTTSHGQLQSSAAASVGSDGRVYSSRPASANKWDSRIELTDEGKTVQSQERFANRRQMSGDVPKTTSSRAGVTLLENFDPLIELTEEGKTILSQERFEKSSSAQRMRDTGRLASREDESTVFSELDSKIELTDEAKTAVSEERFHSMHQDDFVMSPLRVASRQSQSEVKPMQGSPPRIRRISNEDLLGPGRRDVSLLDKMSVVSSHYASSNGGSPARSSAFRDPMATSPARSSRQPEPSLSGAAILSDLQDEENASAMQGSQSYAAQHPRTNSVQPTPNHHATMQKGATAVSRSGPDFSAFGEPSAFADNEEDEPSKPFRSEKYSNGLRALTSKIRGDAKRRRSRRRQRRGYTQMLDDYDSDDSIPDKTPPFEVNIQLDQLPAVDSSNMMHAISDDEQEDLMDNWNALHNATAVGAVKAMHEANNELDGPPENESVNSYRQSITSYHSDPEPAYYSSDETKSEMSLSTMEQSASGVEQDFEDNSTLSSLSASRDVTQNDKAGRQRSRSVRNRRRRTRHHSPVGSMKSGASIISATINEETDQDIIAESSAGEEELQTAYSLARTKSAPEPRQHTLDRIELARGPSFSSSVFTSHTVGTPTAVTPESQTPEVARSFPSNSSRPVIISPEDEDEPIVTGTKLATRKLSPLDLYEQEGIVDDEMGTTRSDKDITYSHLSNTSRRNESGSQPISRALKAKSVSPDRSRKLTPFEWKDDVEPKGVIRARAATAKPTNDEDSSPGDVAERAREIRIRRLQNQKSARPAIPLNFSIDDNPYSTKVSGVHSVSDSFVGTEPSSDLPVGSGSVVNALMTDSVTRSDGHVSDDSDEVYRKYGSSSMMDDLDLQLTLVRRPAGAEYGDDEASL